MISSEVIQKLKRAVELQAILDRQSSHTDFDIEEVCEEHDNLRDEIAIELEDLIQQLAMSGFFAVSIPITPELTEHITAGHYQSLAFECESVCECDGMLHFEVKSWNRHFSAPTPEWADAEEIRLESEAVAAEERKVARHERARQRHLAKLAREEAEKIRKAERAQWDAEDSERAERRAKESEQEDSAESDLEDESGLDPSRN